MDLYNVRVQITYANEPFLFYEHKKAKKTWYTFKAVTS